MSPFLIIKSGVPCGFSSDSSVYFSYDYLIVSKLSCLAIYTVRASIAAGVIPGKREAAPKVLGCA